MNLKREAECAVKPSPALRGVDLELPSADHLNR
jgi:hypothetical protein